MILTMVGQAQLVEPQLAGHLIAFARYVARITPD